MNSAKHSGIGIASFISGSVFALLTLVAVIAADGVAAVTPGDLDGDSIAAITFGAALAGSMVSLRLGVGGVSQQTHNKRFAVLGIALSTATILGIALLMAVTFSRL